MEIALEAARLLRQQEEHDFGRARRRAIRSLGVRCRPDDLPSVREIRIQIRRLDEVLQSDALRFDTEELHCETLRLMRHLRAFHPRVREPQQIGDAGTGGEIVLRVHADDFEQVTDTLREVGLRGHVLPARRSMGESATRFTPIVVALDFPCKLVVYPVDSVAEPWFEPGSGARLEEADLASFEAWLNELEPQRDLDATLEGLALGDDRFQVFRYLLQQLEDVRQDPVVHPEGDLLYHSLQVFDLAIHHRPYDEEFVTAALLHDVGKAFDAKSPTVAALAALEGSITHRTRWFIENLAAVPSYRSRQLTAGERRSLEDEEDFEDLLLLDELNLAGRKPGVPTTSLDDALAYLQKLDAGTLWEATA